MQISKPLNIVPSLLLICGCASEPYLPCLQALGIDAGDVDGQRHRPDDGASG
jgi:hypothetical protein